MGEWVLKYQRNGFTLYACCKNYRSAFKEFMRLPDVPFGIIFHEGKQYHVRKKVKHEQK